MNDLQLIRPADLAQLISVHLSTIYRWEKNGKLPIEKIKIGPAAVGYRKVDVEEWLNEQTQVNDNRELTGEDHSTVKDDSTKTSAD